MDEAPLGPAALATCCGPALEGFESMYWHPSPSSLVTQHPNVIKLIRVINEPDFVVIVLDYAPGGDLKSFLRSPAGGGGRGLPEAVAKEKFLQVRGEEPRGMNMHTRRSKTSR